MHATYRQIVQLAKQKKTDGLESNLYFENNPPDTQKRHFQKEKRSQWSDAHRLQVLKPVYDFH